MPASTGTAPIRVGSTFRSLRNRNYRIYAGGALLSNVGTWMQRTAQDWLVLTALTDRNATAVGIVTALQFAPQLLCLPWTGAAADRFDRRRLLMATQVALGGLALLLGTLTTLRVVTLAEVYVIAAALGVVAAFDAPARQAFVAEMVGDDDLSNAVGLNSTSFSLARLAGPASAGLVITAIGAGPAFMLNAASYAVVLTCLLAIRPATLHRTDRHAGQHQGLAAGLRYVAERADIQVVLLMQFLVVTFGVNFTIFVSTMSVSVFHVGAETFGGIMSVMSIGSVIGGLLAARRERPTIALAVASSLLFAAGLAVAALMPDRILFACALVVVGLAAQTCSSVSIALVQLGCDSAVRGRVVAILFAVSLGGTPLGSPLMGWIADHLGPRWAMLAGALACAAAGAVGAFFVARLRQHPTAPPVVS